MNLPRELTEALVVAAQACALFPIMCGCGWMMLAASVALRHFVKGPTPKVYIGKDDFIKRNAWVTKRIQEIKNGRTKNA